MSTSRANLHMSMDDVESWAFQDGGELSFGASDDVTMQWDGTNFIMAAAADDSLFEIGDSAETQKSFDLKWYGGTASGASYLYFDASADLIYTTGVDFQFKDNDVLKFGTGNDVTITWDGTNLIVAAAADNSVIEIGDSAATQLSFDVKVYGDAANGADYLLWDASASQLTVAGSAYIGGMTAGANGHGLALGVKTTASAPGTTGTPTGAALINTNDDKLYVFNGTAWKTYAADA